VRHFEFGASRDGLGGFLAVWKERFQGIDCWVGQRVDSKGSRVGLEFEVTRAGKGAYLAPGGVAVDWNGNAAVLWSVGKTGGASELFVQRYSSKNVPIGTEQTVLAIGGVPGVAKIGCSPSGDCLLSWEEDAEGGMPSRIVVATFSIASGMIGSGVVLAEIGAEDAGLVAVRTGVDGTSTVIWEGWDQIHGEALFARAVSVNGVPLGEAYVIPAD